MGASTALCSVDSSCNESPLMSSSASCGRVCVVFLTGLSSGPDLGLKLRNARIIAIPAALATPLSTDLQANFVVGLSRYCAAVAVL